MMAEWWLSHHSMMVGALAVSARVVESLEAGRAGKDVFSATRRGRLHYRRSAEKRSCFG
jgi:hypothetical protein